jgi:hypothetical protein
VKIGQVDFSGWLDKGDLRFKADPAGTLAGVTEKLIGFADEADSYYGNWETSYQTLIDLRSKLKLKELKLKVISIKIMFSQKKLKLVILS